MEFASGSKPCDAHPAGHSNTSDEDLIAGFKDAAFRNDRVELSAAASSGTDPSHIQYLKALYDFT